MAKNSVAKHEAGKRAKASNRGNTKGKGALKKGSAFKTSNASSKSGRVAPNGEKGIKGGMTQLRTENTIKRLNMYKHKPDEKKMKEQKLQPMRIQPDRRWFGNTRVITQDKMTQFRQTLAKDVQDPFSVILKSSKLPMSLLRDTEGKASRMDLLSVQPFKETFSKRRQQKKVKLANYDLEAMLEAADKKSQGYESEKDRFLKCDMGTGVEIEKAGVSHSMGKHYSEEIFAKGTSKRIWGELYKVIDCSDVIVFVLDARDPAGTRCVQLEREIRKNKAHKHVILVLNKVDLVPTWVSRRWIQILMKDFPTLAFHASIANPFGKNALLNLLRQFSQLMKDTKHVTVGMIGYPNVGKSSVINTLRRKKVCKAAPVPGETRIWQYVALTKRLYLLDCPGIVPPTAQDFKEDQAKVLKGAVRAERCKTPSDYIDEVLSRTKKQYLLQKYKFELDTEWADGEAFLSLIAHKMGKLLKGGEPDLETAARIVLYDWQRGRIPFFTAPPEDEPAAAAASGKAVSSTSGKAPLALDGEERPEALEDGKAPSAEAGAGASAAASSSSTAPAAGGDDEAAAQADAPKEPAVVVDQSLDQLVCVMQYDEEDRRGEALPAGKPEDGAASAAAAGDTTKGRRDAFGRKHPRQEKGKGKGADASDDEGGKVVDGGAGTKKKPRRGGGSSRREGSGVLRPGVVDWQAVAAEFAA